MYGRARVAVSEFGRHRLAQDHPTRRADQRDASGVGKRPVAAIDRRTVLGRHINRIDDVLDPDWNTSQSTLAARSVDRTGLSKRLFRIEPSPSLDLSPGARLLQASLHKGLGRQRSCC